MLNDDPLIGLTVTPKRPTHHLHGEHGTIVEHKNGWVRVKIGGGHINGWTSDWIFAINQYVGVDRFCLTDRWLQSAARQP